MWQTGKHRIHESTEV